MLPVGCRLPEFEPDFEEAASQESARYVRDEFTEDVPDDLPVAEARLLIMKRFVEELERELERDAA